MTDNSRKKVSPKVLKSHLTHNYKDEWPTWKYQVQIKVSKVRTRGEMGNPRQETEKIDMEINLLQAILIYRDIQQVQLITAMAQDKDNYTLRNHSLIMQKENV